MGEKEKETNIGGGYKPQRYEYEFDIEGDSTPAIIIRMVNNGSRVLEIGAGPGSISEELKREKQCHVTALDIDHQFVERLAVICDTAYQADLNDSNWPQVLENENKFDVVIAADVLEHLWDPWKTLSLIRPLIKEDGEIIISLPHVGHCAVSACLINADFDYRDEGLLDRTHIRFFGLKNIQSLIKDA
ncbi:MAG: class I SAM-dependent methyltransferase, partial [Proteobacteria bacterium]|nr:class I SAM-dependent methyltransferase [Pseudomonadota bacterium]